MENNFGGEIREDPIVFADKMLGIWPHPGQQRWIRSANRMINILRPGNRFGKSLSEALLHIYHAVIKPNLKGRVYTPEEWLRVDYPTLIFGPEYEQSRELLRLIVDLVEGNMLIYVCPICDSHKIHKELATDELFTCLECGKKFKEGKSRTNISQLRGWAITRDNSSAQLMPGLLWFSGAKTLARSYDELGKAFKMKALAFITGDECADIQELYLFTSNTLLPRLINFKGILHFVGTPQPGGTDYQRMIEMAEEDMKRRDWETNGQLYTQKGSVYENIFVDADYIKKIEEVADPELRRQIIDGEFVEIGDKFFGFERIKNMIDDNLPLLIEALPGRSYLQSVDFAYGESQWADWTVQLIIDYTEEPWKVVYFKRFRAKDIPLPVQYEKVKEMAEKFRCRTIIDSSGPGGKNAAAFLRSINPILFDAGPIGGAKSRKSEGLASLKAAMDGAGSPNYQRIVEEDNDGKQIDKRQVWGLIRIPHINDIIRELIGYRLDDKGLRTDCVMALMMGIDWLMMRRPKQIKNKAMDIDFLTAIVSDEKREEHFFPYQRRNRAFDY